MKPRKIELHPGHWKHTGSGAVGILNEVIEARKVTRRIYEILKASNVPATYFEDNTSTNQRQNLNTLVRHHNQDRDGLVVSVHFNASGGTVNRGIGTEVLYYNQKSLADKLSSAISKASGLKNRGAKYRNNLAVLANTYEPAVLIEVCFVNSTVDADLYRKNFEKICYAIAEVLANHIGYKLNNKTSTPNTVPNKSVEKKTVDKELSELKFTSPTLKGRLDNRVISPATKELIVKSAIKELGYKQEWLTKLQQNQIGEGDLLSMAMELAVYYAKYKKW